MKRMIGWLTWGNLSGQKEDMKNFLRYQHPNIEIVEFWSNSPKFPKMKELMPSRIEDFGFDGICSFYQDLELKELCDVKGLEFLCVKDECVPQNRDTPARRQYLRDRRAQFSKKYNKKLITDEEVNEWKKCFENGSTTNMIAKIFGRNWVTVHRAVNHGEKPY